MYRLIMTILCYLFIILACAEFNYNLYVDGNNWAIIKLIIIEVSLIYGLIDTSLILFKERNSKKGLSC